MSYEAYHLAVVHVLLRRRGNVFQLPLGQDATAAWKLASDMLLSAGVKGACTVRKDAPHPGLARHALSMPKLGAIRNSIFAAFTDVAHFFGKSLEKGAFLQCLEQANPYFDMRTVIKQRAESCHQAQEIVANTIGAVLERAWRCLALRPSDVVDVSKLPVQVVVQYSVRLEHSKHFPEDPLADSAPVLDSEPQDSSSDRHGVLQKRELAPSAGKDSEPLKSSKSCAPAPESASLKLNRKHINKFGHCAYHHAKSMLANSCEIDAVVSDLLRWHALDSQGSWQHALASCFEQEMERALRWLRDQQRQAAKAKTLKRNWFAGLWKGFITGKDLTELLLDMWTVELASAPTTAVPDATAVFPFWPVLRLPSKSKDASLSDYRLGPRPSSTVAFLAMQGTAIASTLLQGLQTFVGHATALLSETEQVASDPARVLAEQFAFAYLKCGHKACRLNPNEKGSLKNVANYINGSWSATNVSQHKSSALGVVHSLLSLGKVLPVGQLRKMGANPMIYCNGDNINIAIAQFKKKKKGDGSQPRKKSRSAGANDAPDNSGDNDALRPLPSGTRVLAVDVNQGGFAFGGMTQRVQTRVASVLAGTDAVDEDEWLPDKRDGFGLHWVTGRTERSVTRVRQHEKERGKEKDSLNRCMVAGGIEGLERNQLDFALCSSELDLLRSFRQRTLLLPFSTFLYSSTVAHGRFRDVRIRERRFLQQTVFGVTQDLVHALQQADDAGEVYLSCNRPMPPQGRSRRSVYLRLALNLIICTQEEVDSQAVGRHWTPSRAFGNRH